MNDVCNYNRFSDDINITASNTCYDQISPEVKALWSWIGYQVDGFGKKNPVKATNPEIAASAEDNKTWVPFDQAINALNDDERDLDGIGLVVVRDGKNVIEYDDLASVTVEDLPLTRFGNIPAKQDQPKEESPHSIDSDPRLTINLEETNFVRRYYDHFSSVTDAYREYHHAGALTALSVAADRRVFMKLRNGTYYTNIWALCLGQSSTSRKSTALGYAADMLDKEHFQQRLSNDFTPESFIEQMDAENHSYFIKDEAAGLFAAMNKKPYMSDLRDTLCYVYDNRPISRKLRTNQRDKSIKTDFRVPDPYLTMFFTTTFYALSKSTVEEDFTSGLLCRYLQYYPEYEKEFMDIDDETEEDDFNRDDLHARYALVFDDIQKLNSIRMRMSDTGKRVYNDWVKERSKELVKSSDSIISSVFGRYQVYALKMAMLFTVGSEEFQDHIKVLDAGTDVEYLIPDVYLNEAIREIDEYFIPTIVTIREKIAIHGTDDLKAKIVDILKRSGGEMEHSKLLKASKSNKSRFYEATSTLIDMETVMEIKPSKEQENTERMKNPNYKPTRKYRLNPSSS